MSDMVYLNGTFMPREDATVSPDDRAFVFGDGVYEVARAYEGRFFRLEQHAERMQNGLDALKIEASASSLNSVYTELLERNGLSEENALVYMQVTRGAAPRVHRFPDAGTLPTVYANAWAFQGKGDPDGVALAKVPDIRWGRCDIKSLNLLGNCMAAQRAYESGAFEALLIRDGVALEASAASFFAVFDGEIRTAPASNYILPSITRNAVLEQCAANGIPARETPVFESELVDADEMFLASTTIEVMPVIRVDDMVIGDGTPGPLTRRVRDLVSSLARGQSQTV